MSLDTLVDIATLGAVVFAGLSALYAGRAFKAQTRAANTGYILSLTKEIGNAWEDYITHSGDNEEFYFGQLMALYETACFLINHRLVGKDVVVLLETPIVEVLVKLLEDPATRSKVKDLVSGPETHQEIIAFLDTRQDQFQEQKEYLSEIKLNRQERLEGKHDSC